MLLTINAIKYVSFVWWGDEKRKDRCMETVLQGVRGTSY